MTSLFETQAKGFDDIAGLTKAAMDQMQEFGELIDINTQDRKKVLDEVRTFRMALAGEVEQIGRAAAALKALDLGRIAGDLAAMQKALENPVLRKVLGVQS